MLWFLISGAVPFFGLFAAIAYRFERDELRRQCPQCGRVTKIYDALCTRCGTELDFPEVAIAPESWVRVPAGSRQAPPSSGATADLVAWLDSSADSAALSQIRPP